MKSLKLMIVNVHYVNPFSTKVPLLYPLKSPENLLFFMFPGGVEVEHWLKIS